jgi:hypothetical protein
MVKTEHLRETCPQHVLTLGGRREKSTVQQPAIVPTSALDPLGNNGARAHDKGRMAGWAIAMSVTTAEHRRWL